MTIHSRIRFGQPPAKKHRPVKTKHERIAEKLAARHGEWAEIGAYKTSASANSIAYMIRNAKSPAYGPAGSFEAVARHAEGKYRVWVRYVGSGGDGA